jgi:hypothetical protein
MTRPVVHFEIRGKEPARLREFYRALFGWVIAEQSPLGISAIAAGVGGPEAVAGHLALADEAGVSVYVQVLDLVETLARAEALGGRAVMQPLDVPGGPTVARCADPEGNVIGLVKQ